MIIEEYDVSLFVSRFEDYDKKKNFSYDGLSALFSYLDDSHDEENPYKMDVISLDCVWTEYKDFEDFRNNSGYKDQYNNLDELEEQTIVLKLDNGGFLISTL